MPQPSAPAPQTQTQQFFVAVHRSGACLVLSRPRSRPGRLLFHEMFFPAAQSLSVEEVGVIPVIARLVAGGFINLLPNPSLSRLDGRLAVGTLLKAQEHLPFLSWMIRRCLS